FRFAEDDVIGDTSCAPPSTVALSAGRAPTSRAVRLLDPLRGLRLPYAVMARCDCLPLQRRKLAQDKRRVENAHRGTTARDNRFYSNRGLWYRKQHRAHSSSSSADSRAMLSRRRYSTRPGTSTYLSPAA